MPRWIGIGAGALAVLSLGAGRWLARPTPAGTFFCALNALSAEERAEHGALTRSLRAAIRSRRGLKDGYAFELKFAALSWEELTRWVALERRCCPFFGFRVGLGPAEALTLELTGAPGVKRFIESEIGSGPC